MFRRATSVAVALLATCSISARSSPTEQQKQAIDWVVRSLISQQKDDWSDWSTPADRRVVFLATQTIDFPPFSSEEYGFGYAFESLKTERPDLYSQLANAPIIDLGTWTPTPRTSCGNEDELFPQVKLVPSRILAQAFKGEGLDRSAALVIRISTPVFSNDGTAAAIYAEAVGSHVENSVRELILLTRSNSRPGEWDGMIHTDRLFSPAAPVQQEREISTTDRSAMTAALHWLVTKQGEFDLVGLTDVPPDPAEWRRVQRISESSREIPEVTLEQLSRRNREPLVFDTAMFSINGVRDLTADDKRIWSRPSVLVSLPAYDGEIAILSMIYRTSDELPKTAQYFVVLRRLNGEWSVVWTTMQEAIIVS